MTRSVIKRRRFIQIAGVAILNIPLEHTYAQDGQGSEAVGQDRVRIAYSGADGRILVTDSSSYLVDKVTPDDVVISASFAGAAGAPTALAVGPKAVILHDAGIGLDQAGISALPFMERFEVPCAAADGTRAILSNGNSVYEGVISSANRPAQALGVKPGLTVREAAQLLLKAKPGKKVEARTEVDNKLYELETKSAGGRILAIWGLPYLGKAVFPNDVFALGTHSARVAAEHAFRWNVKGWVANDGGAQPNSPGLDGLKICGEQLMPAAAVAAMSARIGDGMSTWNTGVISAANAPASDKGIRIGMTAKEALRLMVA